MSFETVRQLSPQIITTTTTTTNKHQTAANPLTNTSQYNTGRQRTKESKARQTTLKLNHKMPNCQHLRTALTDAHPVHRHIPIAMYTVLDF